jgi:uncharacterized protein YebE (UPF0316 family)
MTEIPFLDSDLFKWGILPLLIFLARMTDVTLATLRNILLSKSVRNLVPFLGFFEVSIWLLAISQIMKNLQNPVCFVAYAAGYSMGIFVGIRIEERLALGLQVMRIIVQKESEKLVQALVEHNFGITMMDASGSKGPVKVILTVVKRKEIALVRRLISENNPTAFYSIEDIRTVSHGVFRGGDKGGLQYLKKIFPIVGGK